MHCNIKIVAVKTHMSGCFSKYLTSCLQMTLDRPGAGAGQEVDSRRRRQTNTRSNNREAEEAVQQPQATRVWRRGPQRELGKYKFQKIFFVLLTEIFI